MNGHERGPLRRLGALALGAALAAAVYGLLIAVGIVDLPVVLAAA